MNALGGEVGPEDKFSDGLLLHSVSGSERPES